MELILIKRNPDDVRWQRWDHKWIVPAPLPPRSHCPPRGAGISCVEPACYTVGLTNLVSQESVNWLRTNNSKSVDTSQKHADFRDVATEFAPMQVNDADVPWLTHGSPFQRASQPRGLNSKPGVVSLKHLNCPCCVHGSCSNASKWHC